jgi:Skp family chaperone for outer membrane proteins
MKALHQSPRRRLHMAMPCLAVALVCAGWVGDAAAAPACGRSGFWEGEGLQREVEFRKRLQPVFSSYFIFPTQDWKYGQSSGSATVGGGICNDNKDRLRGGEVNVGYFFPRPAAVEIEVDTIREECNAKERQIEQLPEDQKAEIEARRKQLPHVQANKGAMAILTPEEQKAAQEWRSYRSQVEASHRERVAPQRMALLKECDEKIKPLSKEPRYTLHIQINPGGTAKANSDTFHLVADLGDKTIRSGPNDKVRRILAYITPSDSRFDPARLEADLSFLKTQIDVARLQAIIDGGGALPSDADLAPLKDAQKSAIALNEKWHSDQRRLVAKASTERQVARQKQESDARRAAQGLPPVAAPAPAAARAAPAPAPAANQPRPETAAAPAPAPVPAPAPASVAVPNIPQLPGNVGNVLRGVFGR